MDIGKGPLSDSLLLTGGPMVDIGGCSEGGRAGERAAAVRADSGVGGCRPGRPLPMPGRWPKPCMAAARLPGGGGGTPWGGPP